jgi:kynurenine formamidase
VSDSKFPYKAIGARISNWGRWGEDDEVGTLNFITPEVVLAATSSIRSGRRFELSIPISSDGPQIKPGRAGRINPVHLMNVLPGDFKTDDQVLVSDDFIIMPLQSGTQWDGLSHVGYDGFFYNGVPADAIRAVGGASRNSVDRTLPGAVTRGVLLDVARLAGVDWLQAGTGIGIAELEEAEREQGVRVRSGDVLLVRTGWRARAVREGWEGWLGSEPGLTLECAEWLRDREVAALATDNWGVEMQPAEGGFLPLHCVLIRDLGMMLGEMFDLEALAVDCANDGQWDFLFSAPVLRISGGAGSPISPIAIK